jgi:SAM-dependent methyltransferase
MTEDIRNEWRLKSWDEMAKENALAAIMTTPEMLETVELSDERLQAFFARGRELFARNIEPLPPTGRIVEYGCGAGRILSAVAGLGRDCAGIDISETMIELCRKFVPQADLHVLKDGRSGLQDGCASLVYSYAVVQHIRLLSDYVVAFDEMCRLLAPGGVLKVQVSTDDFRHGFDRPGRAENHETYSVHHPAAGTSYRRDQDNWNGVCVDHELQVRLLEERGLEFEGWRFHKDKPSRVVWLTARRPG